MFIGVDYTKDPRFAKKQTGIKHLEGKRVVNPTPAVAHDPVCIYAALNHPRLNEVPHRSCQTIICTAPNSVSNGMPHRPEDCKNNCNRRTTTQAPKNTMQNYDIFKMNTVLITCPSQRTSERNNIKALVENGFENFNIKCLPQVREWFDPNNHHGYVRPQVEECCRRFFLEMATETDKPKLFFEDDIAFPPNFKDILAEYWANLPANWKIALIGWGGVGLNKAFREYEIRPVNDYWWNVYKTGNFSGTHCIAWNAGDWRKSFLGVHRMDQTFLEETDKQGVPREEIYFASKRLVGTNDPIEASGDRVITFPPMTMPSVHDWTNGERSDVVVGEQEAEKETWNFDETLEVFFNAKEHWEYIATCIVSLCETNPNLKIHVKILTNVENVPYNYSPFEKRYGIKISTILIEENNRNKIKHIPNKHSIVSTQIFVRGLV